MQPASELKLYKYCPHCKSDLKLKTIDKQEVRICENCHFVFWNNPKPVVSIVLHYKGRILMLQRAHEPFKNYWVLPGGFIGHDETAQEAIKRETKEETGTSIKIDGLVGIYRIDNDPRGIHIDIIFYGKANGRIKLSKEDKNWQYFPTNNLPENIAYKHREAISDYDKTRHL